MDPDRVEQIVRGLARACAEFGCPLIGGETAEMPGTYAPGDYDLAGFIVGVVDKDKAITGESVRGGDLLELELKLATYFVPRTSAGALAK